MLEISMFYPIFLIFYYLIVIFGFWVADKLNHQSLRITAAVTMVIIALLPALVIGLVMPDLSAMFTAMPLGTP